MPPLLVRRTPPTSQPHWARAQPRRHRVRAASNTRRSRPAGYLRPVPCGAASNLDRQLTLIYLWQRRVLADRSLTRTSLPRPRPLSASSQAPRLRLRRRRSSPRQRAERSLSPQSDGLPRSGGTEAGGGTVTSWPAVPTDGGPTSAGGAIQSRTGPDDAAKTNSTMATPVAALATILGPYGHLTTGHSQRFATGAGDARTYAARNCR